MTATGVIIVGAGQAGCSAAVKLRNLGYDKPITLIGDETHPPYQRPPLSKAYLLGDMARERLFLRPEKFYEEQNISLRLGMTVTDLRPGAQSINCAGETLLYDNLILATGSTPRRLPSSIGGDLVGAYTIRKVADIDALTSEIVAKRRLVVIGGGYIGLEVAAVATKLDLEVTLIEAAPRILQRVASAETSDFFRNLHRSNGVHILENTQITRVVGSNRVEAVELANGTQIPADFVIFGIGIKPNTGLAEEAGLKVDNGVVTDTYGRTSDPHIWAAGDCATLPFRGNQIRLESVGNAIDQAEVIAANISGRVTAYDAKPWFWSDQYDVKLQIVGLNVGHDHTVSRVSREGSLSVWYYKGEILIAVDAMNDPRAYMIAKKLIESGMSPSPSSIDDATIDLKTHLTR